MRKTPAIWLVSIVVLCCSGPLGAQCGARAAEWAYGPTLSASGTGDVAVFSSGRVLQVANITDPTHPSIVGSTILDGLIESIKTDGNLAFVSISDFGLVIVNISRPDRPKVVGTFDVYDWLPDFDIADGMAFLAGDIAGLTIVDVSDPSTPTEIGTLNFDRSVYDVAVHGNFAYLANHSDGLQIVNITDPSAPVVHATLGDIGRSHNVGVSEDGQLVIVTDKYEGLFRLVDVSDPSAPTEVGSIDLSSYALEVAIDGDLAYLSNRGHGMWIYDIADPTAPVEVAQVDLDGSNQEAAIHGNLALLANHDAGLRLVDVSVPAEATELGFVEGTPEIEGAGIAGGFAFLAGGYTLVTLDVSVPTAPVEIAITEIPGWADTIFVEDELGYVPDATEGLTIFDLSDPAEPIAIGTIDESRCYNMAKHEDTVFLACSTDGLRVVDVSNPAAPVVIGSLGGIDTRRVAYVDDILYMPEYNLGVHLIDVSDPTSPTEFGLMDVDEVMAQPVIDDNILYLSDAGYGLRIFDITNPRAPVEIGQIWDIRYGFGVVAVGELIFVADIYDEAFIYDMTDPTAPVQLANPNLAMMREGRVASEGSLVLVAECEGGAEFFDLGPCFSESPTADFTWRPLSPEAGRPVRLTDTSFGSITTRSWDFGDGVPSTDRNPLHIWSEAGAYEVVLTVSGPRGSQSITQTVVVNPSSGGAPPITDPGEFAYVVAASAHAPGLANTRWVTDAVLHNPGSQAAEAYLWFMKDGQNNTGAEGVGVTVAAGTSVLIEDVILSLFEEDNAAGAILIGSDQPLLVTSRTYNDAASGTYGQFIPGRELGSGVSRNETVHLIQLTRTSTFRTNMGVANPTASSVSVNVSVRNAQGSEIRSRVMTVPPFGFTQQTDLLGTNADDAFAVVSSSTPDASYFPYASVVDNRTGDPIMVEPIEPDNTLMIAAAAHVGGLAGTDWRTDLEICNPQSGSAEIELALLATGQNNSNSPSVMLNISAGRCTRVMDVLDASFSHEGTAALVVHENSLDLLASSRTFNTTDQGTFGQFLPGIPAAGVLTSGEEARIIQLTQSSSDSTGFRTNLGFVNRSSSNITVEVVLRDAVGFSLGSIAVQLMPYEHRQINRVFRQVTSAPVNNGTATVSTSSGSFVAYASVVDNASGDPIYIPAAPVGN